MRNVASYRLRRVNEAIKEIIGTALTQDLKDPRIGFVTLTGVDTARDFAHAKVFVSVYGKQKEKDDTLEGLRAARPFLQRLISDELKLQRTPMLHFVYDVTIDHGMHIQALLKSTGARALGPIEEPVDEDTEASSPEGDERS
jgi:ribosome-binding factor A